MLPIGMELAIPQISNAKVLVMLILLAKALWLQDIIVEDTAYSRLSTLMIKISSPTKMVSIFLSKMKQKLSQRMKHGLSLTISMSLAMILPTRMELASVIVCSAQQLHQARARYVTTQLMATVACFDFIRMYASCHCCSIYIWCMLEQRAFWPDWILTSAYPHASLSESVSPGGAPGGGPWLI